MKILIVLSFVLYTFYGCSKNGASVYDATHYDYSIEQSISCFCPQSGEKVKIYVVSDTIADVIKLSDNSHLSQDSWGRYRTINGLFAEITRWDTSSFSVAVVKDSKYHYPSVVSVQPKPLKINDTMMSIITDVGILYSTSSYIKYK
jgi:hypothetical protein